MNLPVFCVDGPTLRDNDQLVVDGAEGHHAAAVRRLRSGQRVLLTDGCGLAAEATVTSVDKSVLAAQVTRRRQEPKPQPCLTVVQALPKGDRGELAVQLMTEVGVDVIVPWVAHRCVARWSGQREQRGLARWQSTARESAKQARRFWWPRVEPVAQTSDVVRRIGSAGLAVVLHESAVTSLSETTIPELGDIVVVVGPEGGLTEEETDAFVAAGAVLRRLGPTVLRTSTAGVVAAALLLSPGPRWSTE